MSNVKEVSSAIFGKIKVAQSNNGKILYSLQDVCRLFGINLQKARMEIRNDNIYEISLKKGASKGKKLFILEKDLEVCLRLSEDEKADMIYQWLKEIRLKGVTIINAYTVKDLKNEETASFILNRLKELERKVSVLKIEQEENIEKIKLSDKLFGKKGPIDLYLIPNRIKYKGLSYSSILEDLRLAGVFNEDNFPNQKYIDSSHFRLIKITTTVRTEETTVRKVLVYQKGIKLIEDILKKKAGAK